MVCMTDLIEEWAGRLLALAPELSQEQAHSYVRELVAAAQNAQNAEAEEAAFSREE